MLDQYANGLAYIRVRHLSTIGLDTRYMKYNTHLTVDVRSYYLYECTGKPPTLLPPQHKKMPVGTFITTLSVSTSLQQQYHI